MRHRKRGRKLGRTKAHRRALMRNQATDLIRNGRIKSTEARCALQVVDLRAGDAPHWLRMEGLFEELYDVVALPGVRRAQAIGFQSDEVRRVISIEGVE